MSSKAIGFLIAILAIGAGAYYLMMPKSSPPAAVVAAPEAQAVSPVVPTEPVATASVEDFSAALDADLQASDTAVGAMDAEADASVTDVQTTGSNSNLYDPNNL